MTSGQLQTYVASQEPEELRRIGDRLVAFTALLPAEPWGTVIAVPEPLASALLRRYPDATVLADPGSTAHQPADRPVTMPEPGSVELVVVDGTRHDAAAFRALLTPDGVLATIDDRGPLVIYPDLHRPEVVWRRGWPFPTSVGPVAQLRRDIGLASSRRRENPRLTVDGSVPSLADLVGGEVGIALGARLELVGLVCAGHTILRFRGEGHDVAVRVTLGAYGDLPDPADLIRSVPALAELVPRELARGTTAGATWVAMPWVPRRSTLGYAWRRVRASWVVMESVADALAAVPTASSDTGWGHKWVEACPIVPLADRAAFAEHLALLDQSLPLGWAHGDPWPGNVLFTPERSTVIDWDNAVDDAPLGLDRVLAAAQRRMRRTGASMATACTMLVDEPAAVTGPVGGRPWRDWERPHRVALALAAFLLYLRNRALHDLGADELRSEVDRAHALLEPPPAPPDRRTTGGGGASRGAAWLGLGAGVVKASQTAVLLVLAAILAPSALGLVAVGSLVVNITGAISDAGSSTALVHWRGDAERAARSALTVVLGLSLGITALSWLLAPWLSVALGAGNAGTPVIRGLMLTLPFDGVAGVSRELLRRRMAFGRRVIPDVVSAISGATVSLVMAFHGYGVTSLVVGQVVQSAVGMVGCWVMRPPVVPGWDREQVRGLLAYGRHLAGANLVQLVMLNVDYLIVAHVLGPGPLGEYSLAFRLAYMPYLLLAVVITGAAFPYLCRLRDVALGRAAGHVVAMTLTVVLPLYAGMLLLAPQLQLLGDKWAPAVPALRWLACYGLLLSVVQVCLVPLNAATRPRDSFTLTSLHLVLLVGMLLGLTRFGIQAVAIGQVVAVGITAIAAVVLLARHVPGFDPWPTARQLVPAVLGVAGLTLLIQVLQDILPWTVVSLPGLALVGLLAVAAYAAPVVLLARDSLRATDELLEAAR